jgi:hypothetical protein
MASAPLLRAAHAHQLKVFGQPKFRHSGTTAPTVPSLPVAFIGSMKRSVKDFLLLFSNFNNYMI